MSNVVKISTQKKNENIPDGYKFNHGSKSLTDCRSQGCIPLVARLNNQSVGGAEGTTYNSDVRVYYNGTNKMIYRLQAMAGTDKWCNANIQQGNTYADLLSVTGSYDNCKGITSIDYLNTITMWLEKD